MVGSRTDGIAAAVRGFTVYGAGIDNQKKVGVWLLSQVGGNVRGSQFTYTSLSICCVDVFVFPSGCCLYLVPNHTNQSTVFFPLTTTDHHQPKGKLPCEYSCDALSAFESVASGRFVPRQTAHPGSEIFGLDVECGSVFVERGEEEYESIVGMYCT